MNVKVYNNASEEHLKHSMVLFISTEASGLFLDKECTHPVTGNEIVDVLEALVAGQLVLIREYKDSSGYIDQFYAGRAISACIESTSYEEGEKIEMVFIFYMSPRFTVESAEIEIPDSTDLRQKFSDMVMPK